MQRIDFASWSGINFGEKQHKPALSDDHNNASAFQIFSADTNVVDHERPKSLYPKLYADDFLYFEVPRGKFEFLRLEMPVSALGGEGTIRFQIPNSMIGGRSTGSPTK